MEISGKDEHHRGWGIPAQKNGKKPLKGALASRGGGNSANQIGGRRRDRKRRRSKQKNVGKEKKQKEMPLSARTPRVGRTTKSSVGRSSILQAGGVEKKKAKNVKRTTIKQKR